MINTIGPDCMVIMMRNIMNTHSHDTPRVRIQRGGDDLILMYITTKKLQTGPQTNMPSDCHQFPRDKGWESDTSVPCSRVQLLLCVP